ncbi:MAG: phosphonate ABC transporter ATP-binding protein [Marinilabiliales bacterium]|nr:MAG: phosphonate ABC transporter ATP-binding protein [Marinilabiliales bacterium]
MEENNQQEFEQHEPEQQEFEQEQPEQQEQEEQEVIERDSDVLVDLRNVNVYQGERIVVENVSLEVRKGELVFLMGRTGSGKSSLLKILYADLPFNGDSGYVLGFELSDIRRKEIPTLRRKLGMIFQDFQLLTDRTVQENLYFVLKATGWKNKQAMDERVVEVMTTVGLPDKLEKMPHQLSGGEQQKVVIARALLNHPDLILADEPTGNLDPISSEEVMNTIIALKEQGITILMATHDLMVTEKFASRTLWFNNGKVQDNRP